jgi:hypothetical protein
MITTQSDLLFLRASEGESQNKAGTVSQLTTSTECVILATKAMQHPKSQTVIFGMNSARDETPFPYF